MSINPSTFEGAPYLTKSEYIADQKSKPAAVNSVNGKTGAVTLAASDVGALASVPSATASAIGGVKMAANVANAGESSATDVAGVVSDLNALATKFNSALSGMQAAGQMASS